MEQPLSVVEAKVAELKEVIDKAWQQLQAEREDINRQRQLIDTLQQRVGQSQIASTIVLNIGNHFLCFIAQEERSLKQQKKLS